MEKLPRTELKIPKHVEMVNKALPHLEELAEKCGSNMIRFSTATMENIAMALYKGEINKEQYDTFARRLRSINERFEINCICVSGKLG